MKLYLEQAQRCVYPDAMALFGTPAFLDERQDVILNPTLVVEVLSSSTKDYDEGRQVMLYRTVPSLKDCLLISQDKIFVEHSARQADRTWLVTQFDDRSMSIYLQKVEIPVSEIYRGIL